MDTRIPGIFALAMMAGMACGDDASTNCGNGVLDVGEACDDGDEDPANGCDPVCQLVPGEVWRHDWTETDSLFFPTALAVAEDGRVYLAGDRGESGIVVALADDGHERWRMPVNTSVTAMATDADGALYLLGGSLSKLDADGNMQWTVDGIGRGRRLLVEAGAVYDLAEELGPEAAPVWVRRLDAKDGALRWDRSIGDPSGTPSATDMTMVGTSLVVLAHNSKVVVVAVDPATGAAGPEQSVSELGYHHAISALDGDMLLLRARGDGTGVPAAVQRVELGGTLRWTHEFPDPEIDVRSVAVGPEGSIVATGYAPFGEPRAVIMSMDPDGALRWTIEHLPDEASQQTVVTAPVFGPGFLVVAGLDFTYTMENYTLDRMWVQRYGAE